MNKIVPAPSAHVMSREADKADLTSKSIYADKAVLLRQLAPRDGKPAPVKLLSGKWLLARAEQIRKALPDERPMLKLPRRQDLQDEAFLTMEQVMNLPQHSTHPNAPLRIVSISHCWLTPEHPDPCGEQLLNFADAMKRQQAQGKCSSGEACCDCSFGGFWFSMCTGTICRCCCDVSHPPCVVWRWFPSGEFAVFYDYCSLHQKNPVDKLRTEDEQEAFGLALSKMGSWYAHLHLTTVCLSRLPEGWESDACRPYSKRGWTTFEHLVSVLGKPANDYSWPLVIDAGGALGECRQAPMTPDAFSEVLEEKHFTSGADRAIVAGIYKETLLGVLGGAVDLRYERLGWGDEEAELLASVLQYATSVTYIVLINNRIGDRGAKAIAQAIKEGAAPKLRRINLDANLIGSSGTAALRDACEGRTWTVRATRRGRARKQSIHWSANPHGG